MCAQCPQLVHRGGGHCGSHQPRRRRTTMDTQQPAEGAEPVWGAAQPQPAPDQPKRWSAGKTAAVVAVAAVVAAGGGYGISQLVGTASATTQNPGGFGAGGAGGFGGGGRTGGGP